VACFRERTCPTRAGAHGHPTCAAADYPLPFLPSLHIVNRLQTRGRALSSATPVQTINTANRPLIAMTVPPPNPDGPVVIHLSDEERDTGVLTPLHMFDGDLSAAISLLRWSAGKAAGHPKPLTSVRLITACGTAAAPAVPRLPAALLDRPLVVIHRGFLSGSPIVISSLVSSRFQFPGGKWGVSVTTCRAGLGRGCPMCSPRICPDMRCFVAATSASEKLLNAPWRRTSPDL
jgi:hypothetical protein